MSTLCCPVGDVKSWWETAAGGDLEALLSHEDVVKGVLRNTDPAIKTYCSVIVTKTKVNETSSAARYRYTLEFRIFSCEGRGGSVAQCLQDNIGTLSTCVGCFSHQGTTEAYQANDFVRTSSTFFTYRTERKA